MKQFLKMKLINKNKIMTAGYIQTLMDRSPTNCRIIILKFTFLTIRTKHYWMRHIQVKKIVLFSCISPLKEVYKNS